MISYSNVLSRLFCFLFTKLFLLIFFSFSFSFSYVNTVNAQNPALEFAAGDGNPTGNGPVTSTTIRFRNNTDNPTGNTFATYNPALTANITLTNQQYTNHPQNTNGDTGNPNNPASVIGWFFGADAPDPIFPNMTLFSDADDSDFTSTLQDTPGTGISIASNRAVLLANGVTVLNGQPFDGRYHMHDLEITFNRPVNNPVLHLVGLGAVFGGGTNGFTAELELLTSGLSLA